MKWSLIIISVLVISFGTAAQPISGGHRNSALPSRVNMAGGFSKATAQAQVRDLLNKAAAYGMQPKDAIQLDATLSLLEKAISISAENKLDREYYEVSMNKAEVLVNTGKIASLQQMLLHATDSLKAEIARQISRYYNDGHFEPKNFQKAKEYGMVALQISEAMNDRSRQINAHNQLGFAGIISRQFEEAERHFMQVIRLDQGLRSDNVGFAYFYLIKLNDRKGYWNRAIALGLDALRYLERPGYDEYAYAIYQRLGNVYANLGEYDKSLEFLNRASGEAISKGQIDSYWYAVISKAEVRLTLGKAGEALKLLQEAAVLHPASTKKSQVFATTKRGRVLLALGRHQEAQLDLHHAEQLNDDPVIALGIDKCLAELYFAIRQWDRSQFYLDKIFAAPDIWTAADMAAAHLLAYQVDSARGKFEEALSHLRRGKVLNDSMNALTRLRQIEELKWQYQNEKITQDVQLKQQTILLLEKQHELERKHFDETRLKFLLESKEKENHLLILDAQTAEKDKRILLSSQNITNLQAESANRQIRLDNANLIRNITVGCALLLVLLLAVLYRQFRSTQRATKTIAIKSAALEQLVTEKEKLLREKDWLLKEVHHRVKNNLQTVVSLLESQSVSLDRHALEANLHSRNRVYAMSLVHQKLYQSEKVASIQMDSYLNELIQYLRESMEVRNIYFRLELTPLMLDVSQAISIGLIVNEAITNAIKHAFPAKVIKPQIGVSVTEIESGYICLRIKDNGIGLPAGFTAEKKTTLGLKLMEGLTGDIMGDFNIHSENGTVISVIFPSEEL